MSGIRTAYGADKLASELHARVAAAVHGVPSIGFRFFNVYGPRQDPTSPYSGVISLFAARVASGQAIAVHGDGRQTRDFVFVADVVQHLLTGMALLERAAAPQARLFNVCTGRATAIIDLAALIAATFGQAQPVRAEGSAELGCAGGERTGSSPHNRRARAARRGRRPEGRPTPLHRRPLPQCLIPTPSSAALRRSPGLAACSPPCIGCHAASNEAVRSRPSSRCWRAARR